MEIRPLTSKYSLPTLFLMILLRVGWMPQLDINIPSIPLACAIHNPLSLSPSSSNSQPGIQRSLRHQMSRHVMLNFQQHVSPQYSVNGNGAEEWCFEQGSSSKRGGSSHWTAIDVGSQLELQRNLVKERNEWKKLKEEMRYAKQFGEHLADMLMETERRVEVMRVELQHAEKGVRDYMMASKNDRTL